MKLMGELLIAGVALAIVVNGVVMIYVLAYLVL